MILFLALVLLCLGKLNYGSTFYKRVVSIPNKRLDGKPWMTCTRMPISKSHYIVDVNPLANPGAVHHMSLHSCESTYIDKDTWECESHEQICGVGKRHSMFEWARDGPGWKLPPDTGISTGKDSRYMVLQIHTIQGFNPSSVAGPLPFTGLELTFQNSRTEWEVGVVTYGSVGYIPPNVKDFTTDSACAWKYNITAPILSYYTHTHEYGKAVTGWIYRDEKWIEIGRMDPSYQEVMVDIAKKSLEVRPGDIVAARCTYDNPKDHRVYFKAEAGGEMCNFHIHFAVKHDELVEDRTLYCAASAQDFRWEDHFSTIPSKANDPSGNTEQAQLIKQLHLRNVAYRML